VDPNNPGWSASLGSTAGHSTDGLPSALSCTTPGPGPQCPKGELCVVLEGEGYCFKQCSNPDGQSCLGSSNGPYHAICMPYIFWQGGAVSQQTEKFCRYDCTSPSSPCPSGLKCKMIDAQHLCMTK
jgi:hypothetical protein